MVQGDQREACRKGGALSPLFWTLHVNRAAQETLRRPRRTASPPGTEWRVFIHLFADDTSAAITRNWRRVAGMLVDAATGFLLQGLPELDLDVSNPKCYNFLVGGHDGVEATAEVVEGCDPQEKTQGKKSVRHEPRFRPRSQLDGEEVRGLPLKKIYSFKLRGVALGCNWNFSQHAKETQKNR